MTNWLVCFNPITNSMLSIGKTHKYIETNIYTYLSARDYVDKYLEFWLTVSIPTFFHIATNFSSCD
jgi:hypothetical protein